MTTAAILLLAAILALRGAEILRYRDRDALDHIARKNITALVRPTDAWYQLVAMGCAWLEIGLSLVLASRLPPVPGALLAALVIAARMRALQEIGHTALHLGFGDRKQLQWQTADWLGNYWLFKPNSGRRFQSHCAQHHPNANTEIDPNIQRMRRIGFVPGLGRWRFRAFVLHPLTPSGLQETLALCRGAMGAGTEPFVRLALQGVALAVCASVFGAWACAAWLLALLLFYPLFSWWSLLAEHRWFAAGHPQSRLLHDCAVTPRTSYSGLSAMFIRYFVSPCTDSRHLAHHVYPRLHWHYLPLADRHLEQHEPAYRVHTKTTFFGRGEQSILSELEGRFVRPPTEVLNHAD